jgi:hypothetical protein
MVTVSLARIGQLVMTLGFPDSALRSVTAHPTAPEKPLQRAIYRHGVSGLGSAVERCSTVRF